MEVQGMIKKKQQLYHAHLNWAGFMINNEVHQNNHIDL